MDTGRYELLFVWVNLCFNYFLNWFIELLIFIFFFFLKLNDLGELFNQLKIRLEPLTNS